MGLIDRREMLMLPTPNSFLQTKQSLLAPFSSLRRKRTVSVGLVWVTGVLGERVPVLNKLICHQSYSLSRETTELILQIHTYIHIAVLEHEDQVTFQLQWRSANLWGESESGVQN